MEPTTLIRPLGEDFDLEIASRHEHWYAHEGYEWLSTRVFRDAARLSDVVIDVGAHVGWYAIQAGRANPDARVIAVEGSPSTSEVLARNLRLLGDRAEIHNAVFGAESGTAHFHITEASDNCSLTGHPNSPTTTVVERPMLTGADLGLPDGTRLLVKIDVEGHELAALRGLQTAVDAASRARLLIEFNPHCLAHASNDPRAVLDWLWGRGFKVFALDDRERSWRNVPPGTDPERIVDFDSYVNLYCVRGTEVLGIAAIAHSGLLGGAERSHLEAVQHLRECGHLVTCFCPGTLLRSALTELGVPTRPHRLSWWVGTGLDADPGRAGTGLADLREDLARMQPDVVITTSAVVPGGALAARSLGVAHVWGIHEFLDLDHGFTLPLPAKELGRVMGSLSDLVVVNSEAVGRHFFGEADVLVASPMKMPECSPGGERFDEASPVIGVFGAIQPSKGHGELVEAVRVLRARGVTPRLRIFGTDHGGMTDELKRAIREGFLTDAVEFVGEVDDAADHMRTVDIVAVPSWCEAFGRTPLEAVAVGKPVVYSNAGGMGEYMTDGVTGVAFEPRDADSLADAIERLVRDPDLRGTLRRTAWQTLDERFRGRDLPTVLARELPGVVQRHRESQGTSEAVLAAIETVAAADAGRVVADLRAAVDLLERRVDEAIEHGVRINMALADTQAFVDKLQADLRSAQAELSGSQSQVRRALAHGDELARALELKTQHATWLEGERQRLTAEIAELTQERSRLVGQLDAIRSSRHHRIAEASRHPLTAARHRMGILTRGHGRPPWHELFDADWYLDVNPDVRDAGVDPLDHYTRQGASEGRDPHPLFSATWYLRRYPDVAQSDQSPLEHFVRFGAAEGRWPNPLFDTAWYLTTYADVAASGVNPLLHYWTHGWKEGRLPNADWDPSTGGATGQCPLVAALHPPAGSGGHVHEAIPLPVRRSDSRLAPLSDRGGSPALLPPAATPVRVVAFYLPQFHRIPQNDLWWGEGYTEWTAVRRGTPVFPGHHQPRIPGDLGYYDLVHDPRIMRRQAELARNHGVSAFCFYIYWFGGTRLLETPVEHFLADPTIDIGFTVCWANENWTRTWDGDARTGLMVQDHSPEDDIAFIDAMMPALRDPRAVRVADKPLLIVYRPGLLPDPAATADRWRARCRDSGIGEIVLGYVRSFDTFDPAEIGFDYSIEFPPPHMDLRNITDEVQFAPGFSGIAWDLAELSRRAPEPGAAPNRWRGVCPSWDNTARRPADGTILVGEDPVLFRDWVYRAGADTVESIQDPSARLVFVNAWNEWSEGAYLEPDRRHGYQWLHGVRDAQEVLAGVEDGTGPGIVVVAHDMHKHGAQLLSLAMARWLSTHGFRVEVVALGPGALEGDFADVATTRTLDDADAAQCANLARDLHQRGFRTALCNSSVTGRFSYYLARAGVDVVGLVHELPEILNSHGRGERASFMPAAARRLIFPAEVVRDRFPFPISTGAAVSILPQGVYSTLPDLANPGAAAALRLELGLPAGGRIVLGAGFGDRRKGFDLFCRALALMIDRRPDLDVHGVWIGGIDAEDREIASALSDVPSGRLIDVGFVPDPSRFYSGADVLALTSREDPFPSVVLEGLAAGLPCVAFRGCTGLEGLLEEAACALVEPLDASPFADACLAALEEPGDLACRREVIQSRHSFHHYMFELLSGTAVEIPKVSVVIPSYNYGRFLGDRIRQVLTQTVAPYEIIVVDDASSDDSVDVAREALDGCGIPWKLVVNDTNSGSVVSQWIKGVGLASGDLIWIAEADDVARSEFLAEVTASFSWEDVVLSYCQSRQVDEDASLLADDYLAYTDGLERDFTRRYIADGADELTRCLSVKNSIPNVSAVVFRGDALKASIEACRGEVERLRYAADWRLYVELMARGAIAFSTRSLNDHRRHPGSVIGSGDAWAHVREIAEVQQAAAAVPGVRAQPERAREWCVDAARMLGIADVAAVERALAAEVDR